MRIPHIDKIPPKFAAFCIRFQFFTVLSLTSVTIKYQFIICVLIRYQFFTRVSFDTNFFTCDDWITIYNRSDNLVPILYTFDDLVPIHICENLVSIIHSILVLHPLKTIKIGNFSTHFSSQKLSKLTLRKFHICQK